MQKGTFVDRPFHADAHTCLQLLLRLTARRWSGSIVVFEASCTVADTLRPLENQNAPSLNCWGRGPQPAKGLTEWDISYLGVIRVTGMTWATCSSAMVPRSGVYKVIRTRTIKDVLSCR